MTDSSSASAADAEQADQLRHDYWRLYAPRCSVWCAITRRPHRFLRETHDFRVEELMRIERGLARMVARLPGRKVLLSNAPGAYAAQVARRLGLHRTSRALSDRAAAACTAVPPQALHRNAAGVLAREGLGGRANAGRAVLVERQRRST